MLARKFRGGALAVMVPLGAVVIASVILCALPQVGCSSKEFTSESDDGAVSDDAVATLDTSAVPPDGPTAADCSKLDFKTDAKNCGTCGHDCLGGACKAGMCQPFVIADAQNDPRSVAVHGSNVYWTEPRTSIVKFCPASGCVGDGGVFASGIYSPMSVAADPSYVFMSVSAGQIVRADPASAAQTTLVNNQLGPAAMTQDRDTLYWLNSGSFVPDSGKTANVSRVGKDGGNPAILLNGLEGLVAIAVNSTFVYYTTLAGAVRACPLPSCAGGPVDLVDSTPYPYSIAADDKFIYWTAFGAGTLMRCAAGGCNKSPETIAQGQKAPHGLVLDGQTLYWANVYDGTIMSCPVATCGTTLTTVASGQTNPANLTTDSKAVYWVNQTKYPLDSGVVLGSVVKIAK